MTSLGSNTGGIAAAWVGVASLDFPGVMARGFRDLAIDCVKAKAILDIPSVESDSTDMGELEGTCLKGLRMVEEVVESWRKRKVARLLEKGGLRWSLGPLCTHSRPSIII